MLLMKPIIFLVIITIHLLQLSINPLILPLPPELTSLYTHGLYGYLAFPTFSDKEPLALKSVTLFAGFLHGDHHSDHWAIHLFMHCTKGLVIWTFSGKFLSLILG